MRVTKGPLIKVVVFVVTMGLLICMVGMVFGRVRIEDSVELAAVFTDASGLTPGSDVRGNGVAVGAVKDVRIDDEGHARVRFTVASHVRVSEGTAARIRYANLTGDRYLDLTPGETGARLAAGATIPLERTQPALDLDEFFQGFDPLMRALDPEEVNQLASNVLKVTQGQAGAVQSMLENVGSFTNRLAERDELIGETITNLSAALALLDGHHGDLDDLVTGLADLTSGLAQDRRTIGASLKSIDVVAADTADLLDRVRPGVKANVDQLATVAKSINGNSDEITEILDAYPRVAKKIGRLGAYGSFFNFYMCGVKLKLDLPGNDLDVYTPWVIDNTGRCSGEQR